MARGRYQDLWDAYTFTGSEGDPGGPPGDLMGPLQTAAWYAHGGPGYDNDSILKYIYENINPAEFYQDRWNVANRAVQGMGYRPFNSVGHFEQMSKARPGYDVGMSDIGADFDFLGEAASDFLRGPALPVGMAAGAYMAAPAAGAGVGASAAPGTALYSTPAEIGGFLGNASTPAMTTYAGPGGTALGGFSAPATTGGLAGAATAIPIANTGSGITQTPLDGSMGFSAAPEASIANVGAPTSAPFTGTGAPMGLAEEAAMLGVSAPTSGSAFSLSSLPLSGMAQTGLGLYELYRADKMEDAYNNLLSTLNQPSYDYSQNYDLVQSFLRDPMSLLSKSPGYQASVDYLTKKGQREMAAKGMTGSGNIGHYLADVLGKNAMDWHKQLWNPISEAAGLKNDPNRAQVGQVGINAMQQAEDAKRRARGEIFNAGRRTLPDLFRWATS